MKKWHVYILQCKDGSYYTGTTNDVDARMKAHAEGRGSKYVSKKGFRKLLKVKECQNQSDACKCECVIKKLPRREKLGWFE